MYLSKLGHYVPEEIVPNAYFEKVNGLTDEWIFSRTGIKERRKASAEENANTMAIEAVRNLIEDLNGVDLIVSASYTPHDTVATISHVVQKEFAIDGAQAVYVSSACSSLVNAIEIVEGYFATGKSKKALVIASEHNTAYSDESCEKSGHLWGDGAFAMTLTKDNITGDQPCIIDICTKGLGNIGQGPDAVYLIPYKNGLEMPNGRDVFMHAVENMEASLEVLMERNNLQVDDINYLIPHQANDRIIVNLSRRMKFNRDNIFSNIARLGNTGCASTGICLSENFYKVENGSLVGITVFGGGYSSGALLIQF